MVREAGMMFLADIFWIIWLAYCVRESESEGGESDLWMLYCGRRSAVWDEFVWVVEDNV